MVTVGEIREPEATVSRMSAKWCFLNAGSDRQAQLNAYHNQINNKDLTSLVKDVGSITEKLYLFGIDVQILCHNMNTPYNTNV